MLRAVELLGGGILGFIAGSFLCAPLIAHVFGPTPVTWDASACPPGIYAITSTAASVNGGPSYTTTTTRIRLPQSSVVQEFSDLPPGQYTVTAVARDSRGRVFHSDAQSVSGLGQLLGRRASQTNAGAQGGYAPVAAKLTAVKSSAKTSVTATATPASIAPPERRFRLSGAMAELLSGATGSEPGLLADFPQWKSITFIDEDDDGVIDTVRIEFVNGEVWVASARTG